MLCGEATLYFLSGTGNSYRAATWMEAEAQEAGARTQIRSIQGARPEEEIGEGPRSLLGLVTPTHGFTAPWAMLRFVLGLPRRRGTHAFVVATRAGSRLGRHLTPGFDGTATYILTLILLLKGYRIRGLIGLNMPSNWTTLHSGLRPETVTAIIDRASVRIAGFISAILSGRRDYASWAKLLLGLLLLPISFAYLLVGRFYMAKLFFASGRCTGCGLCAANCPLGAIKMWEWGEKIRPYWTFRCENTMRCMGYCPAGAIEAGHSWAAILYVITSAPVVTLALNWLTTRFTGFALPSGRIEVMVLQYGYTLLALYLAYLPFTLILRVPWINRLFTLTTLTHTYRRYHEPDTSLKDLQAKG